MILQSQIANRKSQIPRAFTLVEVIIVVAIVGIAAAIVVPQMLRAGTLGVQAAGRMVIADLLYAQNEAIARQSPRRIVFDVANNRYSMTDTDGNVIGVTWKGNGGAANYVVDFTEDSRFAGVRMQSADFGGESFIEYNDLGSPAVGGTVDLVAANVRYRITVSPFTGRVIIAPVAAGG